VKIGRRLQIRTSRFRLRPDAGISRMNQSFCGGFHVYWLGLAVEYDHLSAVWNRVKTGVTA
jgi:hypothetical protein